MILAADWSPQVLIKSQLTHVKALRLDALHQSAPGESWWTSPSKCMCRELCLEERMQFLIVLFVLFEWDFYIHNLLKNFYYSLILFAAVAGSNMQLKTCILIVVNYIWFASALHILNRLWDSKANQHLELVLSAPEGWLIIKDPLQESVPRLGPPIQCTVITLSTASLFDEWLIRY